MKAFKTTLTDGRIFYVTHYTKGEAVACFEARRASAAPKWTTSNAQPTPSVMIPSVW
jgi:hypothetical protein